MTTNTDWIPIDPAQIVQTLKAEVVERVNHAEGEVVLDLSLVRRIDADAVKAMEELAALAGERSIKIVLRGVNGNIYKVFKILGLDQRFSFGA
jgi:anti-anti-sigma regulatory factor